MEQTNGSTTLCLNSDWLDYEQYPKQVNSVDNCTVTTTFPWVDSTSNYATYWPNYWHTTDRKITLKLSEVMYLREKAADDKKLRKVLKKFAPHIEITVDFPGNG